MLTLPDIKRPGEGVTVVCVEPHYSIQYGDLNTSNAENGMVSHGNVVRELVREQAPYAKVFCSGHPPNGLLSQNIDIINLSLADADPQGNEEGPIWADPFYRMMIETWLDAGIIVVAPTGNIRKDIDNTLNYDDQRMIVVGASDWEPGSDGLFRTDVLASARTDKRNGTSYAAPRVSGVCAVLQAFKKHTPDQMRRLIRNTQDEDGTINLTHAIDKIIGFPRWADRDGDGRIRFPDMLKLYEIWGKDRNKMIAEVEDVQ